MLYLAVFIFGVFNEAEAAQTMPGGAARIPGAISTEIAMKEDQQFPSYDAAIFQMAGALSEANADKYLQWEIAGCLHNSMNACRANPDVFVMLLPPSVRAQVANLKQWHDAGVGGTVKAIDLDASSDMPALVKELVPTEVLLRSSRHPAAEALEHCSFTIALMGGLGPVAGATLLKKVVGMIKASPQANNVCVVLYARTRFDNLFHEIEDTAFFTDPRFSAIGVACNTFHIDMLPRGRALAGPRLVNMLEAASDLADQKLKSSTGTPKVLLIGTPDTINSGLYQKYVTKVNQHRSVPISIVSDASLWNLWWPAAMSVEQGAMATAGEQFSSAAKTTLSHGQYSGVMLGCTEFSASYSWLQGGAPGGLVYIDPLQALAEALVKRTKS